MSRDFTKYDAYIESGEIERGLLFQVGAELDTQSLPLQPTKQDTGQNPNQIRPEYGQYFAQGDFSEGSQQQFFHLPNSSPSKFYDSMCVDIATEGRIRLSPAVDQSLVWSNGGDTDFPAVVEQAFGSIFAAWGGDAATPFNVYEKDADLPGTWAPDDASLGELGTPLSGATRLYFQDVAAPASPTAAARWNGATSANRRKLAKTKSGAVGAYTTAQDGTFTQNEKYLVASFVSDALATGTVFSTSNQFSAVFNVAASSLYLNAKLSLAVRIMGSDHTTQRVMLLDATDIDVEWVTDHEARIQFSVPLGNGYTTIAGDYLVVEAGFESSPIEWQSPQILQSRRYTGTATSVDLEAPTSGDNEDITAGTMGVIAVNIAGGSSNPNTPAGYTLAFSKVHLSGLVRLFVFIKANLSAAEILPTVTWTGSQAYTVQFHEVQGIAAVTPLDRTATGDQTGSGDVNSAFTGTTAATTQANEFFMAFAATDFATSSSSGGATNGYAKWDEQTTPDHLSLWIKAVAATQTTGTTVSLAIGGRWVAGVATFKIAASGADTATGSVRYGGTGDDLSLTSGATSPTSSGWVEFSNAFLLDAEDLPARVYDLRYGAGFLYAALGGAGLHRMAADRIWATYSDVEARIVRYLKDRVMVCSEDKLYEITAGGVAPAEIDELPTGWRFTSMCEGGAFIYASAINTEEARSRIYVYGSDTPLTAIEPKGSTPLPRGEFAYSLENVLGNVFIGTGHATAATDTHPAAKDPVLYQAFAADTGELTYQVVALSDDRHPDSREISAMAETPRGVLAAWAAGDGFTGIARYDLAKAAFSKWLCELNLAQKITSIVHHNRRTYFAVPSVGVFYEDTGTFAAHGEMVTSIADWNNAGLKSWDFIEITHPPLPAGAMIEVFYTTDHPESEEWTLVGTSDVEGDTGATFLIDVTSRYFTLRFVLHDAAELLTYSARSNPSVAAINRQNVLKRRFRILATDRRGGGDSQEGPEVHAWFDPEDPDQKPNPNYAKQWLHDLINSTVHYHEADVSYRARIEQVTSRRIADPKIVSALGNSARNGWDAELTMVATKEEA